jgi:uncharacterized membrane protein
MTTSMNTAIWTIQGILSVGFILSGIRFLFLSKEKLNEKISWTNEFSSMQINLIGFAKLLGGIGVILPSLILYRWSFLTPLAAISLGLVLIGVAIYHISKGKFKLILPPVVSFLMAVFIVYQFALYYIEVSYSIYQYGR